MARKSKVSEVAPPAEEKRTEQAQSKKGFEPIMYVSRGKAFTLWVDGGKKKVQFNNNGVVGIFIAKSEAECKEIEATRPFVDGNVWRANGEVKGSSKPVVVGVRSSVTQPQPLPVEPEVQKIIEESNQAAKRPVSAE